MRDATLHSYNIMLNKKYKVAIQAIRQLAPLSPKYATPTRRSPAAGHGALTSGKSVKQPASQLFGAEPDDAHATSTAPEIAKADVVSSSSSAALLEQPQQRGEEQSHPPVKADAQQETRSASASVGEQAQAPPQQAPPQQDGGAQQAPPQSSTAAVATALTPEPSAPTAIPPATHGESAIQSGEADRTGPTAMGQPGSGKGGQQQQDIAPAGPVPSQCQAPTSAPATLEPPTAPPASADEKQPDKDQHDSKESSDSQAKVTTTHHEPSPDAPAPDKSTADSNSVQKGAVLVEDGGAKAEPEVKPPQLLDAGAKEAGPSGSS